MPDRTQNNSREDVSLVQRLGNRQRQRTTIVLDANPAAELREEASEHHWQLLNIWHCGGELLPGMDPKYALVAALPDSELVQHLLAAGCTVVRMGNLPHPLDPLVPAVIWDQFARGRKVAEHFHERNFRDVGYTGFYPWKDSKPLFDGFRQRAAELGMACHLLQFRPPLVHDRELTPKERYAYQQAQFTAWIRDLPKPLGLLSPSDRISPHLCFMAAQSGLDVPTDVAIFSNSTLSAICENATPPISSFADDRARTLAACALLRRLIAGEAPPQTPILVPPPAIIERESTNVLAVSHPVVGRAMRFIWDHLAEPMSVNNVAEAIAVSRSSLDRLFRRHLNRSVNAELTRKRLEKTCQLLRDSDMTMAEIAAATGFGSPEYLRQAFRKAFGTSPNRFRRRAVARG